MRLAVGCDHAGYQLKKYLIGKLEEWGHQIEDVGCHSEDSVDYPPIAEKVAEMVRTGTADLGILICGTGQGMAMTANKVPGIRAAVCQEVLSARAAREHNNANVITIGARVVGSGMAELIVREFLQAEFAGGRHQRRLDIMADIEKKYLKQGV